MHEKFKTYERELAEYSSSDLFTLNLAKLKTEYTLSGKAIPSTAELARQLLRERLEWLESFALCRREAMRV